MPGSDPTIYDKYGNTIATLGDKIKKFIPLSYGLISDIVLDFDEGGNEVIRSYWTQMANLWAVSNEHCLEATEASGTDNTIISRR